LINSVWHSVDVTVWHLYSRAKNHYQKKKLTGYLQWCPGGFAVVC